MASNNNKKQIIAVCGATGAQGGSVARFLLEDGTFAVRALTRQPDGEKAKALAAQGAEVVSADFADPAALNRAFEGVYGVFGHTNYWDPSSEPEGKGQIRNGKNQVDAAKAQGVRHYICSCAESTGAIAVPHWETQAAINAYLLSSGVPRTSFYTSFYYENMLGLMPFKKVSANEIKFNWPIPTDSKIALFPVSDVGGLVLNILKDPKTYIDKDVKVASEFLSPREFVATINDVLSTKSTSFKVTVDEMDVDTFEGLRGQIWDELWTNTKFLIANSAPPFRDPTLSRKLYPKLKTLRNVVEEEWEKLLAAAN